MKLNEYLLPATIIAIVICCITYYFGFIYPNNSNFIQNNEIIYEYLSIQGSNDDFAGKLESLINHEGWEFIPGHPIFASGSDNDYLSVVLQRKLPNKQ